MARLEELCRDYLEDRLSPEDRKWLEERIANGDKTVISTLRRLQAFEPGLSATETPPDDPETVAGDKLSDFLADSPDSQSHTSPQPPPPDLGDSAFDDQQIRHRFLRLVMILGIVMIFVLVVQQWRLYQSQQESEMLAGQIEQNNRQLLQLDEQLTMAEFQQELLQDLLFRENLMLRLITFNENRSGTLLFILDGASLDHALLTRHTRLNSGEYLHIWHHPQDDEENWQILDSIDRLHDDSLYTGWDINRLHASIELEIRLHNEAEPELRENGTLIETIPLP